MIFYSEEVMWNIFRFFQSGMVDPLTEGTIINKIGNVQSKAIPSSSIYKIYLCFKGRTSKTH